MDAWIEWFTASFWPWLYDLVPWIQARANETEAWANQASASASAAGLTANALMWNASTNYAIGQNAISPSNFQTYRRRVSGVSATDPASDSTNWAAVAAVPDGSVTPAKLSTGAPTWDQNGNLLAGTTNGTAHTIKKASSDPIYGVLTVQDAVNSIAVFAGGSTAAASVVTYACLYLGKQTSSNRSLNAAGTINASGSDYAEYMTKAGDFAIAKGDVVGINAEGKLTNVFADAISFVVKSTDPSYVGGDKWGSLDVLGVARPNEPCRSDGVSDDEWASMHAIYQSELAVFESILEAARQKVDRIAFCGQVPVNVIGATAGQYIVPFNSNGAIVGQAVSNPTFEQYRQAVGKVIAIEQDGRARIIVNVA
jgi:hypothetical protein